MFFDTLLYPLAGDSIHTNRIMLLLLFEHDLFRKPAPAFLGRTLIQSCTN